MIGTKAILAVTLMGMGAGVMTANVYLSTRNPAPVRWQREAKLPSPKPVTIVAEPLPAAPESGVVALEPVTIFGRVAVSHDAIATPPVRALVPCSEWRALESGPAGHGVRTLCYPVGASLLKAD